MLAVVIVLSVLLGSHRSLMAERAKVEAQFSLIAGDLQDCLDITANLLTVGSRYLEQGDLAELEQSRSALADWSGISSSYTAYSDLQKSATDVLEQLESCAMSAKDEQYVQGFRTDLASEADTIARDGYNEAAEKFNQKVLGVFPANLLAKLTFVDSAELFA